MRAVVLILLLGLAACSEQESLQQYTLDVRTRPAASPEPVPAVTAYIPQAYNPASQRSPFAAPLPETAASLEPGVAHCEQPDRPARVQPLQQYSLENLSMRGTLQQGRIIKGLISAPDGTTHTVIPGDRVGLNHGEITAVSRGQITLTEYLPDGRGCWERRQTALLLVSGQ